MSCSAPPPRATTSPGASALSPSQPPRTLSVAIERVPATLGLCPLRETFASAYLSNSTSNADFATIDDAGVARAHIPTGECDRSRGMR